jgi:predicted protein tyrosine phosphatase
MEDSMNKATRKLLFICRFNQMRSRTAECIFSEENIYQVTSAGTDKRARRKITGELILRADMIFVMEDEQGIILKERFLNETSNKKIINLDIPDSYNFMEPELVCLIKERVSKFL